MKNIKNKFTDIFLCILLIWLWCYYFYMIYEVIINNLSIGAILFVLIFFGSHIILATYIIISTLIDSRRKKKILNNINNDLKEILDLVNKLPDSKALDNNEVHHD